MAKTATIDFDSQLPVRFVDDIYTIYLREKSSILETLLQNGASMNECTNTKYEWTESQLSPLSWTVNGTVNTGFPKTIALVSTTGMIAGDIIRFEDSAGLPKGNMQLKITSVDSGTQITVNTATYGSTTDIALAATNVAKLVSRPAGENKKSFTEQNDWQPSLEYNYTQIFDDVFGLSGTALATAMYGNTNDVVTQLSVSLYKVQQQMAEAMIHGRRVQRTSTENGTFGGFISFLDVAGGNVKDASSAVITQQMINDSLESVYQDGGDVQTIVCGTYQARKISAFNTTGNNPIVGLLDRMAGSFVMKYVGDLPVGPNGMNLAVVVDPKMPKDKIILTDLNRLALVPMKGRSLALFDATQKGQDGITAVIRGEYTLVVKDAKYSHAIIKNLI